MGGNIQFLSVQCIVLLTTLKITDVTSIIKTSVGAQDSEITTRWRENLKMICMTNCDL